MEGGIGVKDDQLKLGLIIDFEKSSNQVLDSSFTGLELGTTHGTRIINNHQSELIIGFEDCVGFNFEINDSSLLINSGSVSGTSLKGILRYHFVNAKKI